MMKIIKFKVKIYLKRFFKVYDSLFPSPIGLYEVQYRLLSETISDGI